MLLHLFALTCLNNVASELSLKYLSGYPSGLTEQVSQLLAAGKLGDILLERYGAAHTVRTDKARLNVLTHALGTHTTASRVQGSKLKAKREIRIATLFKEGPEAFLKMITVHELAHLKEREHDKAFYQLCTHMEPNYHQYEFDLRAYLCLKDASAIAPQGSVELASCILAWSSPAKPAKEQKPAGRHDPS
jgi:UTP pyrophosphatase